MFRAALHTVISDFFHLRLSASVGVISNIAIQPQGVYSVCSFIDTWGPVWGGGGGGGRRRKLTSFFVVVVVLWGAGGGGGGGRKLPLCPPP